MEVIGKKDVSFKAKDGSNVVGLRLYVTDDSIRVDDGVGCDSLFLSAHLLSVNGFGPAGIEVGDHLVITYNKYGKIQQISIV